MEKLQQFMADVNGKTLTVTGPDQGQCTAVAHAWEKFLGTSIVYGDAKDTYANAGSLAEYDQTLNRSDNFPAPGAIVVLGPVKGNPYGHTFVNILADTKSMKVLSQNDPLNTPTQIKSYGYDNVIGWFTPKNLGDDMPTLVDQNIAADLAALGLFREGAAQTDPEYLASVLGKPVEVAVADLVHTPEHQALAATIRRAPEVDRVNADLQRQIGSQQETIAGLNARLAATVEPHQLPPIEATSDTKPAVMPTNTGPVGQEANGTSGSSPLPGNDTTATTWFEGLRSWLKSILGLK